MLVGSNHFVNLAAATRYYAAQGDDEREIAKKISEGRIKFGAPACGPYQSVRIFHGEGRYYIIQLPKEFTRI